MATAVPYLIILQFNGVHPQDPSKILYKEYLLSYSSCSAIATVQYTLVLPCRLASSSHSGCLSDMLAFILTIEELGNWPMGVESSASHSAVVVARLLPFAQSFLFVDNATSTTII